MSPDLHVVRIEQQDPRLGRNVVHDPRSRSFAFTAALDMPTRSFRHRVFSPQPLPRQTIGCCTGVDQCVRADAAGNRVRGKILGMADAVRIYSRATELDPWDGTYPPTDTGSSGLAAAKAAKEASLIERYAWIFSGVDQVLTALRERPVGVGTRWHSGMFNPEPGTFLVRPTGPIVGGHQWSIIGWHKRLDAFEGLCWWGPDWAARGLFRIRRADLATLLADDGDAHVTYRAGRNG